MFFYDIQGNFIKKNIENFKSNKKIIEYLDQTQNPQIDTSESIQIDSTNSLDIGQDVQIESSQNIQIDNSVSPNTSETTNVNNNIAIDASPNTSETTNVNNSIVTSQNISSTDAGMADTTGETKEEERIRIRQEQEESRCISAGYSSCADQVIKETKKKEDILQLLEEAKKNKQTSNSRLLEDIDIYYCLNGTCITGNELNKFADYHDSNIILEDNDDIFLLDPSEELSEEHLKKLLDYLYNIIKTKNIEELKKIMIMKKKELEEFIKWISSNDDKLNNFVETIPQLKLSDRNIKIKENIKNVSSQEKVDMIFELKNEKQLTNTEDLIDIHMWYTTSLNNSNQDGIMIFHGNFNNEHKLYFIFD